ncbi:MAG: DUF4330 domain-containing protein [Candidatus Heteroscillospira sp.]|jgi:hypothetical protein
MEKKRRFNIIDLAIIVVLLAAVAFFANRFMTTGGVTVEPDKVSIVFFEEECPDFVPEQTQVGDSVMDGTTNTYMGKVTDVKVDESVTYSVDQNTGEVILGSKEGYVSAYITAECEGTVTDNGVVIDGTLYSVGHTVVLHAGYGKYYLVIYSIDPVE